MYKNSRHHGHDRYRSRILHLFSLYEKNSNTEKQAEDAKYLAVLVSGYLEQAIKEILLQYSVSTSGTSVAKYIKDSWPSSKNMNTKNIEEILKQFNERWAQEFNNWLNTSDTNSEDDSARKKRRSTVLTDRKSDINSIISWRNYIAHGQESKTTNVTLVSVKDKFETINKLVVFMENLIIQKS